MAKKEKLPLTPEEAKKKFCSLLGIAQKAGRVASGEFMTEKSVKEGRARLVVVAGDASDNTKKMFQNMCDYYEVPYWSGLDKDTLGHVIGKEFRASLAVNDDGFCKALKEYTDMM